MWQVYKKELLELVRDRKTLFFVIALPLVIFPVIFALMGGVMASAQLEEEKKIHRYVIVGAQYAPEFAEDLFYHKSFEQVESTLSEASQLDEAQLIAEIKQGAFDMVIIIPAEYVEQQQNNSRSYWRVIFNDASLSDRLYGRISALVNKHSTAQRKAKLAAFGLSDEQQAGVINPITLVKVDTADTRENLGEKVGGFIPYLLIPLCLVGAVYPAIDLGAGEKERGTLETLLLTPVPRTMLVLGKFAAILTTSLLSALLTVSSMGFWAFIMGSMLDLTPVKMAFGSIGAFDLGLIFALLLPLACIFASVVLAISIYARSFKEAQNYMAPLNILTFLPIAMALVPGISLNSTTAMVPVMNVALAIKEIVKGTVDYQQVALIFLSQAVLAVVVIGFSIRWFNKESVLFR